MKISQPVYPETRRLDVHLAIRLVFLLWGAILFHPTCASSLADDIYLSEADHLFSLLDDCIDEAVEFTETEDEPGCDCTIEIQQFCEPFYESYHSSSLKNLLTPSNINSSTDSLLDLHRLLDNFDQRPVQQYQVSRAKLNQVIENIYVPQPETGKLQGWWDILVEWFKNMYLEGEKLDTSWLHDLISQLQMEPETWVFISYALVALIILLALAIVINELRLSNVKFLFSSKQSLHLNHIVDSDISRLKHQYDWNSLDNMDTKNQILYLWNMVLSHLQKKTGIKLNEALTNREIIRSVKATSPQQAQPVSKLSMLNEAVLYGDMNLTEDQLQQAKSTTIHLLKN